MSLEVLVIASLSCDQNLGKKWYLLPISLQVSTSGTVHVRVDSGTGGQLLIWFGSLVASWGDLQRKAELNGVLQRDQFALMGCFG